MRHFKVIKEDIYNKFAKIIGLKRNDNFYVITGGPGVGKTTLLNELMRRNYEVVPEIARKLIKEQTVIKGEALPWKDKELYKTLMFDRSIESYRLHCKNSKDYTPTFFDRSFLDAICYATIIGSEVNETMERYAYNWRYNKKVFVLPPWEEIYEQDPERKQDWAEAVLTYEKMVGTYAKYGYTSIEVPKLRFEERADYVLNNLENDR